MEATDHTQKQKPFKCYAKRLKQDPSTSTSPQSDVRNIASTSTASENLMPQNHDNDNVVALDFKQSSDSTQHTIAKTKINSVRMSLQIQRLRARGLRRTLMSLSRECERIDQENKSIEKDIVRSWGKCHSGASSHDHDH